MFFLLHPQEYEIDELDEELDEEQDEELDEEQDEELDEEQGLCLILGINLIVPLSSVPSFFFILNESIKYLL